MSFLKGIAPSHLPLRACFAAGLLLAAGTSGCDAIEWTLSWQRSGPAKPIVNVEEAVKESMTFLKDREPQMKESELALYERVVPMVFSKPDLAISLLERMLKDKEVESPAFDFALANVYFNAGRAPEAEVHYRDAVTKFPEFLRAWVNLGILYYQGNQFDKAIDCFSRANNLGAPDAEVLGMMAYCLRQKGNPIAAEAAYMQALTLDPKKADWTEGLVSLYLENEDWPRAEKMLRYLLDLKPGETRNWKLTAWVLRNEGKTTDAMACLDVARARGVLDAEGRLQLGDLRRELGLTHEAVEDYLAAAAAGEKPGYQRLLNFVSVLIIDGRSGEAEKILSGMPADLPDEIALRRGCVAARLHLARENPRKALEALNAVEKFAPLDGELQLLLGEAYEGLNQPDRAQVAYETSSRQDAFRRQALLMLANLALRRGDCEESIRLIRETLAIQDDPRIREYLLQLQTSSGGAPSAAREPQPTMQK
jgi:tetratricopeptide (TPR) repeat protein